MSRCVVKKKGEEVGGQVKCLERLPTRINTPHSDSKSEGAYEMG